MKSFYLSRHFFGDFEVDDKILITCYLLVLCACVKFGLSASKLVHLVMTLTYSPQDKTEIFRYQVSIFRYLNSVVAAVNIDQH